MNLLFMSTLKIDFESKTIVFYNINIKSTRNISNNVLMREFLTRRQTWRLT